MDDEGSTNEERHQARMVVERTEAWWKRRDLERDRVRDSVENLVEEQRFGEEERHRGRKRSRWGSSPSKSKADDGEIPPFFSLSPSTKFSN
ncbi:hypothetical protein ACLOJK_025245 [Asimina triloba]